VNGRFIVRFVAVVVLLAVMAGIGVSLYNAGLATGLTQVAVQSGQPVPVVPYGYGPYWHGPGFFGIIFWIIGFFLIIGLIRAAFGFGRGGRGHWGHGWDKTNGGPGSRSGWGYGGRGEAIADWHRELHRREESGESESGTDPGTGRPTAGS
jgi:hypothetical protein